MIRFDQLLSAGNCLIKADYNVDVGHGLVSVFCFLLALSYYDI